MTDPALSMTATLRDELAANDEVRVVDPRTVPVRYSTLKQFAQSPAHYLHAVQRGYEETLSMRIGSGAHAILFGQPYTIWEGKVRNGKIWDAFEAEHAGELILSKKEHAEACAIVKSIREHATAMRLLFTDTKVETRIDWTWQGREFRSTPDAASRTHCVDLKCLKSAQPDKVLWQSRSMYYHAQAALYRRALNETGHNIKDSYLVVVENKAPYIVTCLRFTETALEMGDRSCVLWFEQLRNCEESNNFPGYVQTIVDLELPGMSMDSDEFDDE